MPRLNKWIIIIIIKAAGRIAAIPKHLYDEGYHLVSFDVKSLFINVPLQTTINIIVDRIYNKNIITAWIRSLVT